MSIGKKELKDLYMLKDGSRKLIHCALPNSLRLRGVDESDKAILIKKWEKISLPYK